MEETMGPGNLPARAAGIVSSVLGIVLIAFSSGATGVLSGTFLSFLDIEAGERAAEMMGRAGFAFLLMGLFTLFMFSFRSVPEELALSFARTSDANTARLLTALNLEGKGTYMPPGGRLLEDRVYVPMEKLNLPLPKISDAAVFNVGTTSPSMGISLVPPGKDLVDLVEERTGRPFSEDRPSSSQEALERLTKGTGLYGKVSLRSKEDAIEVTIAHSRMKEACKAAWGKYPLLHERTGCVGCSAVLCALARVHGRPLRIVSVSEGKDGVTYGLERV